MTLNGRQVDEHLSALAQIKLTDLSRRLGKAVDRDRRGGTARPDGYSPNTGYDKTSGESGFVIDNERVVATSVELTVIAREERTRDPLHESVTSSIRILERLIKDFDRLAGLLDGIDNMAGATEAEPACSSCARIGLHKSRERADLCSWCYGFKRNKEWNPTGALPSVELLQRRENKPGRLTSRDIKETMR